MAASDEGGFHGRLRAIVHYRMKRNPETTTKVIQSLLASKRRETYGTLRSIEDGVIYTDSELKRLIGRKGLREFLRRVSVVPWVTIERVAFGRRFFIDHELRAICEDGVPRPELNGAGVRQFVLGLAQEIDRRRKENNEKQKTRNWNSEKVWIVEQKLLLDWIEEELSKLNRYLASGADHDSAARTRNHPEVDEEVNQCTPKKEPVLRC